MSRARWVLGLVLLAVLATGNVLRETCWTQAEGFVCGPLAAPGGEHRPSTPVRGLTRIELPAPAWRPLAIRMRLTGDTSGTIRVSDGTPQGAVSLSAPGEAVTLRTSAPAASHRLSLWADGPPVTTGAAGAASLEVVGLAPVITPSRVARALLPALLAGLALLWAVNGRPAATRPVAGAEPRIRGAAFIAPIALLLVTHGAWVVLRPPLQAPDEPQHHARATSVAATPYVAGEFAVPLAASHRNPLTWTPNRLHAIIFKPAERLSADDVAALRQTPWIPAASYPPVEPVPTGVASYPPVYYWVVFAGGELVTGLFDLSPYRSVLAYRASSVVAAGVVWLAVYALLLSTPAMRPWALPAFALLVATPGTAAITASINPDALVVPATALLFLATWRALHGEGTSHWVLAAAALGLAVKPSGFLAVGAAAAGIAWWMVRIPVDRPQGLRLLRILTGTTVMSIVLFYAWSPPRLTPGQHPPLSIGEYLGTLLQRAPDLWVQYWGWLGWQEYGTAPIAYWLVLAACLGLLAAAWCWPPHDRRLDALLAVSGMAYLAGLLAGEYANHARAALVLQGRYLLPLSVCLLPVIRQRRAWAAWALPLILLALHVALAGATTDRYFGGDWALWWRSLTGA